MNRNAGSEVSTRYLQALAPTEPLRVCSQLEAPTTPVAVARQLQCQVVRQTTKERHQLGSGSVPSSTSDNKRMLFEPNPPLAPTYCLRCALGVPQYIFTAKCLRQCGSGVKARYFDARVLFIILHLWTKKVKNANLFRSSGTGPCLSYG